MNFELTEEQQLIGQSARDFAKQYLEPIAVELDHGCGWLCGLPAPDQ